MLFTERAERAVGLLRVTRRLAEASYHATSRAPVSQNLSFVRMARIPSGAALRRDERRYVNMDRRSLQLP